MAIKLQKAPYVGLVHRFEVKIKDKKGENYAVNSISDYFGCRWRDPLGD
jgi:hypothetical protein